MGERVMAPKCEKCGIGEPVMCGVCVDQLVDLLCGRVRELQSLIARLSADLDRERVWWAEPAAAQGGKDDG
jgi:hypothetical protein